MVVDAYYLFDKQEERVERTFHTSDGALLQLQLALAIGQWKVYAIKVENGTNHACE